MNPELIAAYRKARAPYFPASYPGRSHFTGARSALHQARMTLECRATRAAWDAAGGETVPAYEARDDWEEGDSRVRIVEHPDECACMDDLKGESFSPDVNHDINPNILAREEREFEERVQRDGVFGYVAQWWDGDDWQDADSIWGFVSDDFTGSGYDDDLMRGALDALAEHLDTLATVAACEMMQARPDMHGAAH